ncbi:MAG: translocation/assembly module TamB domain-containing protein [Pseudohongiellaceae bacterium]
MKLNSGRIWRTVFIAAAGVFLLLLVLLGVASFLLSTQTGSQWALNQAQQRLNDAGVSVVIEDVQGTIFRGLSFGEIRLDDATGSYVIEGLHTSWNPYSLLTGQLLLSDLRISSLGIEIPVGEATDSKMDIDVATNPLPIAVAISRLQIDRLEFVQQEQQLTLHSISLAVQLDNGRLGVTALQLSADGLELAGEFDLEFIANRPITGLLDWRYATTLNNRSEELAGRLEIAGDLSKVELQHELQIPQRIQSSGSVLTGLFAGELEFDLNHSADRVTLPLDIPANYEISNVSLETSGNFENIALTLHSDLQYEQYPAVTIDAEADYAASALNLRSYNLSALNNEIAGAAMIDWSDVFSIEGSYELTMPSLESLVELPSSVSLVGLAGSGNFDVTLPDAGAEGRLTIAALSGRVADYPMQGQGSIRFNEGSIEIEDMRLQTQSNQLGLSGTYSDSLDLNWSISAASLEEFLVGSSGVLEGQGSLSGDPAAPDIAGRLSGSNLSYQQFSTDQFEFDFQRTGGEVHSELSVGRITYQDGDRNESLSPLVLVASGTEGNHRMRLDAQSRYGDLTATMTGAFNDFRNLSWAGSLETASIDTPLGSWSTGEATDIAVASTGITVDETCWRQEETLLCFTFGQNFVDGITVTGSLQDYPLTVFNLGQSLNTGAGSNLVEDQLLLLPQLLQGATMEGQVDARFSLSLPDSEDLNLDFELSARDAVLSITSELLTTDDNGDEEIDAQEYNLERLEVSGSSQEKVWQFTVDAGFLRENLDDSEIDVRGSISADVGIAANNDLFGTVEAGLEDLRWLQALLPDLSDIGGSLNGRASLAGSISAPEATGSIELSSASASIDRLGIELTDITANVSSDSPESVRLTGRAQSETGSIEFNGEIIDPFGFATTFSAEVKGENFQLANVPNLELNVSPDVVVSIDAASIEVNGSLDVPTLKLRLEQLPETAVDVSRDVVIVNYPSDRPDLARSIAATETTLFDRPVSGTIDITLGEEVTFAGFGMNTKLAGNLNIQQTENGSNRTYGELSIVEGTYEMYRQSLNISQGKFLFFGAYDNPGIDLRATRDVDNYTVGVLMNGTLKNISSQLFSTPALPDNDIIAVLVTGRPFSEVGQQDGDALLTAIASLGVDRSEGLTNQVRNKLGLDVLAVDATDDINNSVLTIGKYLTPDIFVRYGIGLFDSQSKVAVDYTVTEHVKFQAESGEHQSVDIIYSVER